MTKFGLFIGQTSDADNARKTPFLFQAFFKDDIPTSKQDTISVPKVSPMSQLSQEA